MKLKSIPPLLLLPLFMLLLASCSENNQPLSGIDATVTVTPSPTATSTPVPTTSTAIPPQVPATPIPSVTPTQLSNTIQPRPIPAGISMVTITGKTTQHDRDQTWSFTAEEGTFVRIKGGPIEGSIIDVAFELFGPGGSLLHINIKEGVSMPSTGEYLLVVMGAHDTTGDYFLEFTVTPSPTAASTLVPSTSTAIPTQVPATPVPSVTPTQLPNTIQPRPTSAGISMVIINHVPTGLQKEDDQLQPSGGISPREASEINIDLECNRPYYDSQPASVDSDSVHRYYEYYWQSSLKICINVYEADLIDAYWEDRILKLLTFAKDTLGLILPVNVTVLDQRNSSSETLNQVNIDECSLREAHYRDLDECVKRSDAWGERSNSAGVDGDSLLNGGFISLFAGTWNGYEGNNREKDRATKIFLHEYFHIHQNSLKFYFESTGQFGIPIAWMDDPSNSIYEEPPTQPWVFPNWIEEGGAEFAGMILAAKFDPSFDAKVLFEEALDEARIVVQTAANNGDTVSLKDYEYQGGLYESSDNPNNGIARQYAYQYTGGAWALMYLWSLDKNNLQKIMVDYYKQWAEKENANPGYAWKDSFESLFEITLADFYKDFDAFMLQSKESQMAILKTNDEIEAATLTP